MPISSTTAVKIWSSASFNTIRSFHFPTFTSKNTRFPSIMASNTLGLIVLSLLLFLIGTLVK